MNFSASLDRRRSVPCPLGCARVLTMTMCHRYHGRDKDSAMLPLHQDMSLLAISTSRRLACCYRVALASALAAVVGCSSAGQTAGAGAAGTSNGGAAVGDGGASTSGGSNGVAGGAAGSASASGGVPSTGGAAQTSGSASGGSDNGA